MVTLRINKTPEDLLKEEPGPLSLFGELDSKIKKVYCRVGLWTNNYGGSFDFPSLKVLNATRVAEKYAKDCPLYSPEEK
jgi:hypothetical protein